MSQPKQSFWAPTLGAIGAHVAVIAVFLNVDVGPKEREPPPQEVVVTFKVQKPKPRLPPPPPISDKVGGQGSKDGAVNVQPARRALRPPIVPMPLPEPVLSDALPPEEMEEDLPAQVPDDVEDAFGFELGAVLGTGDRTGNGSGPGAGLGVGSGFGGGLSAGNPPSKARKAWFATHDWKCDRPANRQEDGRVLVRIRVTISTEGRATEVQLITPGPEIFNQRALDCAEAAEYVSALDDEGNPIVGVAQFAIDFIPEK